MTNVRKSRITGTGNGTDFLQKPITDKTYKIMHKNKIKKWTKTVKAVFKGAWTCSIAAMAALLLLAAIPSKAQQIILAGGGSLSQGNVACTISIGEVFTNASLPSSGYPSPGSPSFSTGMAGPSTDGEITASASGSENNGDDDKTAAIQAFYNPSTQSAHIRFGVTAAPQRTCRVYILNGLLRQTASLPDSPESVVSLHALAQGVYLLQITAGNHSITVKVIKK
jgi:hypothetical protein